MLRNKKVIHTDRWYGINDQSLIMLATIEVTMHPCRFGGSENGDYYSKFKHSEEHGYPTEFSQRGKIK